jgi:hypothetical protein
VRTESFRSIQLKVVCAALVIFAATFIYTFVSAGDTKTPEKPNAPAPLTVKDESGCYSCHNKLNGKAQVLEGTWAMDSHHNAGLECTSCHNGNPDKAITMANWKEAHLDKKDAKGKVITAFIGKPTAKQQLELCGSCHENTAKMQTYKLSHEPVVGINAVYTQSSHGKALLEAGNTASASCVSCHGGHGAMSGKAISSLTHPKNISNMCGSCHSSETYMKASLDKKGKSFEDHSAAYMQSVHANAIYVKGDLGAPTCNDCHSNHGDHLAEVQQVNQACNTCHASVATAFHTGPHESAYAANGMAGCISCHGSPNGHAIANWGHDKVGAQEGAQCTNCHNNNVPEKPAALASSEDFLKTFNLISITAGRLNSARDSVMYADAQGFYKNILYLTKPLETLDDSLKIAEFFFRRQKYNLKLDNKQDSALALKLAPEVLKYATDAKRAELKNTADTITAMLDILDYGQSTRRYYANLRALGSATKDHEYLTSLEEGYAEAKEFFEFREKKGDYVKPELTFLEEFGRQADGAGTAHHAVRSTLVEESLKEGFVLRDSTAKLVQSRRDDIDGRRRLFLILGAAVFVFVFALGVMVSRMNVPKREAGAIIDEKGRRIG